MTLTYLLRSSAMSATQDAHYCGNRKKDKQMLPFKNCVPTDTPAIP